MPVVKLTAVVVELFVAFLSYKGWVDVKWTASGGLPGPLCVKVGRDFMRPDERGIARA
jgi:hypothetical protein